MDRNDLIQKRNSLLSEMETLVAAGGDGARSMSDEDLQKFTDLESRVNAIDETLKRAESVANLRSVKFEDPKPPEPRHAEIGMTEKELKRYSVIRAINAVVSNDWAAAGLELEVSRAVEKQLGKSPRSFFIPADWQQRDVTKTLSAHTGENLVATKHLAGSFIGMLRNKLMVQAAGARVLTGLKGDLSIPKLLTGSTGGWVAEDDDAPEGTPTFTSISLTPKTVAGFAEVTRLMLMQSSPDVDMIIRDDLVLALKTAIDLGALHGTGSSNQPTGIAATSGIGSVVGGTNGLAPAWSHIVDLETEVAIDNADIGSLSYMTNAKVRGALKKTEKSAGTAKYLWEGKETPLNGYPAHVTNQVSSTLTKGSSVGVCSSIFFGNWNDLIIALWGGLDVLVDPFTNSQKGRIRVIAFQSCDVGVRYPQSFAAMLDALT